jgi:ATP-dependent RNA helicase RhlE
MANSDKQDDKRISIGSHPVDTTDISFGDLGLSEPILKSIELIGFKNPTPIQSAVIRPSLEGKDVMGLAQTGSGKTAAFVIPMAERLMHGKGLRGLIICPTREIALQSKAFLDLFGKHHELKTVCVIGGVKMGPQIKELKSKPDIVVATPGRLADHMNRRNINLDHIEELVLDEADHMLDMGFIDQIRTILRSIPKQRHTTMFSATMPRSIEGLAKQFLNDPLRVDILPEGGAAEGISHRLYMVDDADKKKCLLSLLNQELGSTLVFTRTKIDADWLCRVLEKEGHPVTNIHSDRSQSERTKALSGFRKGEHRILIATDIAARGIDVPGIEHIVNFGVTQTVEEYIHRAGRTARMDEIGIVSTICTWLDKDMIARIEAEIEKEIPRCSAPGVEAYVERAVRPTGRNRPSRW